VIARHGQRSVRQVRAEGAGVDLPSWVSTRSPGLSVSTIRSPSGVAIRVPVAKQLKTCALLGMYADVLPAVDAKKGAMSTSPLL